MSIANLTAVFREVFEDDSLVLRPDMSARDVPNWDSLNHINLMIAIEAAFAVTLSPGEVQGARSVGDLVKLLQARDCQISW